MSAMRVLLKAAVLASAAVSFAPTHLSRSLRRPTVCEMTNTAAYETALAAAEKASAEFGKDSTEAKSAWETVEEMNDAENPAVASKPPLDEACDTDDPACATYEEQMKQFSEIIASAKPSLSDIKVKLENMQSVSLSDLMASGAPTEKTTVDVEAATAAAEKASADFGKDSPEAKAAWETVEEMNDAANPSVAAMPALDEACLADAVEKCAAFESAMDALESAVKQAA